MQADEVQNAKEPIAAQIDLSGQTLRAYLSILSCTCLAAFRKQSLQAQAGHPFHMPCERGVLSQGFHCCQRNSIIFSISKDASGR